MVRAFAMQDPTFYILLGATGVAFAVLFLGLAVRAVHGGDGVREQDGPETAWGETPQPQGLGSETLPGRPGHGVGVGYYRPTDWVWAGVVCLIFLGLSLGNAWVERPAEMAKIRPQQLVESMVLQFFIAGLTAAVVVWRVGLVEWLGLRWGKWPWLMVIAPMTVFAMWVVFAVIQGAGYVRWLEGMGLEAQQDTVKLLNEAQDPQVLILMAIAAVVVAPLCEEVVFRGFLYPLAKRYAGMWAAMIFSAVVFAVAHSSVVAVLPLAVFGVVLAVLYERTRSIWAPIAVHALFNGATVMVQLMVRFEWIKLPAQP
jgi:membrane protease YdiL (CAAX protease family)